MAVPVEDCSLESQGGVDLCVLGVEIRIAVSGKE